MPNVPISLALSLIFMAGANPGFAQSASPASPASSLVAKPVADPLATGQSPTTTNQLIERIQVEDSATRIDEVRVGGESRSISVAPKGGLPAYDVQPVTGARTWKIFGF